jgi:hypothetical protein
VLEPALGGELAADLAEHLGLQLGEVRDGAAHRTCGVVLGQPVGGHHVGVGVGAGFPVARMIGILALAEALTSRVRPLGVEAVRKRRFVGLVVHG